MFASMAVSTKIVASQCLMLPYRKTIEYATILWQ
jgi:hypothetical protein